MSGEMELLDTEIHEFLANFCVVTFTADLAAVAWHPDASEFIISGALFTRLYNADGEILHTISLPPDENIHNGMAIRSNAYSIDGARFYVLIDTGQDYPEQYRLAVADRLSLTVTDTCMVFHSSAQFSPDGRQMALLSQASGRQELLIFDIENWQLYCTGIYHDGEIIGWRKD